MRAAEALADAEVLLYDALASDVIVALAPSDCESIYVGKRGGKHEMPQEEIEALMIAKARDGYRVVRLKGGDPFVFGRGGEEAQRLHAANIPFEIVPGISSSIAAPAYAGIPVTHRDYNTAFTVMTGHEDPTKPESTIDWSKLADPHRTLVLLMAMGNLASISAQLIEAGLSAQTSCAVIANGTRPSQRTVTGTLADIAMICVREAMKAPAIVIIGDVVRVREELRWFDRDPLFGKRILITRPAKAAHEFARALYRRGIEPILGSTIRIGPPDDPQASEAAVAALAPYTWIVFTSRNGVERFFDLLHASQRDARALGSQKIAAIGAKTAAALRDYGIDADLVPKVAVGEELAAALIAATTPGDHMLLFRAQDARDVLPERLRAAQRTVSDVAAYATHAVDDAAYADKVAKADILTFTSASTVTAFVQLLGGRDASLRAAAGKCIACIGPITAAAAKENGLPVDVLSDTADTDALLDAISATFTTTT